MLKEVLEHIWRLRRNFKSSIMLRIPLDQLKNIFIGAPLIWKEVLFGLMSLHLNFIGRNTLEIARDRDNEKFHQTVYRKP